MHLEKWHDREKRMASYNNLHAKADLPEGNVRYEATLVRLPTEYMRPTILVVVIVFWCG